MHLFWIHWLRENPISVLPAINNFGTRPIKTQLKGEATKRKVKI